jgi:5'-nucleotidase (lipoprotein e(P4) family)
MRKAPLFLLLTWMAAGCRTATVNRPVVAAATPGAASAEIKLPDSIHWFRNSAEYRALAIQTYLDAGERLAEIVGENAPPGTWAVALDADETVLNNSQYNKERALQGLGYSPDSWRKWVERKEAPPIPGSVAFLERVHALGGKIAIVTNRTTGECPFTETDFQDHEIPYDVILCKSDSDEKEARWKMIEEGNTPQGLPPLHIVMWVGDNITDFPDLDQTIRTEKNEAAFADFGRRFIVLPNPMYGSWTSNPRE